MKQYAVVVKVRKQISGFVNNPEVITTDLHTIVDVKNHPQRNEIDVDWFYDENTNTFSKEGEVPIIITEPEPEPEPEPLTEIEQAIMDTALNTEYLVCLSDMGY